MLQKNKKVIISIAVALGLLFAITTGCTHNLWQDTIKQKRLNSEINSFIIKDHQLVVIEKDNFFIFTTRYEKLSSLLKRNYQNNKTLQDILASTKIQIMTSIDNTATMFVNIDISNKLLTKNDNDYFISHGFQQRKNTIHKTFILFGSYTNIMDKQNIVKAINLEFPLFIRLTKQYIENDYSKKVIETPLMLLFDILFIALILMIISIPFLIIQYVVNLLSK